MSSGKKVLVVGSGGREHALVSVLARSATRPHVYCAPGNAGIAEHAEIVPLDAGSLDGIARLADFAASAAVDLTVIGPEAPLVLGIADRFAASGLKVCGPPAAGARLEGSKCFAKEFLARHAIPTAAFHIFADPESARAHVARCDIPVVVKADGLAAGKGVIVARTREEALEAVETILVERRFGEAGARVVVEDCLEGSEVSLMVVTDGEDFVPLATAQDYKAAYDGGRGPNTGGMGSYSPCLGLGDTRVQQAFRKIIRPTLDGLRKDGIPFRGILYAGLMLTRSGPQVLEFNVRLGDPEAQAIFPRLTSDAYALFDAASQPGGLARVTLDWDPRAAVCIVAASGGYPGSFAKGFAISGLDDVERRFPQGDVRVFHSGTQRSPDGQVVTSGGRVLGVSALGSGLEEARLRAYAALKTIRFDGMRYRTDIGDMAWSADEREGP